MGNSGAKLGMGRGLMDASATDDDRDRSTTATRESPASAGPVAPASGARAKLRPLDHDATAPDPGGFLGGWQPLNRAATIDHCIARLESSGNLENLRRLRDPASEGYHGYWFADSDIYKVLEAIGWETGRAGDAGWTAFVDDTVALLREAQDDDGYINSYIQGV